MDLPAVNATLNGLAALLLMLPGCSGFQPVRLEHDMDKEKPLDYREGDWIPKNT